MAAVMFRLAVAQDCSHLVFLADTASRGLATYLWGATAEPGQSAFEVGRAIIRGDQQHFAHFKNWSVAEMHGDLVGALVGYVLPQPLVGAVAGSEVVRGMNELKALAAGSWYISAAALYPEFQGRGLGRALLDHAEMRARTANCSQMTLLVGSFNHRAVQLYRRCGFAEWARRPFSAFPGSDPAGDWILMGKRLQ